MSVSLIFFNEERFLEEAIDSVAAVSSECWDRYRIHEDSFWRRAMARRLLVDDGRPHPTARRFLEWLEAYLHENVIQAVQKTRDRVARVLSRRCAGDSFP